MRMVSKSFLSLVFILLSTAAYSQSSSERTKSNTPEQKQSTDAGEVTKQTGYAWVGSWISNHYAGGYIGGIKSLSGDDFWRDGFLLGIEASGGQYSYLSNGKTYYSNLYDAAFLLGYRKNFDQSTVTVFVGPSMEQHSKTEVNAALRGFEAGVKIAGEYRFRPSDNSDLLLRAAYSTPFSVYTGSARFLYRIIDKIWIGPQVTFYGNRAPYQEATYGIAGKYEMSFGEIGFASGYRQVIQTSSGTPSGKDGYFFSIYFGMPF